MESPDTVAIPIINQGELIPEAEDHITILEEFVQLAQTINLYVSMGQPFNVSPPDKQKLYNEVGIGGMISFNRFPGELDRKTVATGIRNSGGHAFNPKDGTLWFTETK